MSVHISSAVWARSQASGAALLVLLSLADQANDEGECWPSVEKIAERCRVSRRSVFRYLNELRMLGELSWDERKAERKASVYTIHVPGDRLARDQVPGWHGTGDSRGTDQVTALAHRNVSEPSEETSAPRPEVEALCELLADRIEGNGSKRPTITKVWRDELRRLIDIDGRSPQQVRNMIEWCQRDPFWKGNILSAPKLRAKYDQMRLKAETETVQVRNPDRIPWTPEPPPREIQDDPVACDDWYRQQAERRRSA